MESTISQDPYLDRILADKRKHQLDADVYEHYRDNERHAFARARYCGENWDFAHTDPGGNIRLFKAAAGQFFAIETNWIDPVKVGPVEMQKSRLLRRWLELGGKDADIRLLADPKFGEQSFTECENDAELVEHLTRPGWPIGQAFYIDDMCFINRSWNGDDWLAIKGRNIVGPFPLREWAMSRDMNAAQQVIQGLRCSTDDDFGKGKRGR